jgi:hypothetical protein
MANLRTIRAAALLAMLAGCGEEGAQSARVRSTATLDLETGEQGTPQADLHWGMQGRDLPYLAPRGEALIAPAGKARWEDLDEAALRQLSYATTPFSAWGPEAPVRRGSVFGVRTREGNFAKLRVNSISPRHALKVEWKVYQAKLADVKAKPGPKAEPKPEPKPEPKLEARPESKPGAKPQPIKPGPTLSWFALRDEALAAYRAHRHEDANMACGKAVAAAQPVGEAHHALALVTCGGLLELHRRHPDQIEDWLRQAKALTAKLEQDALVSALGPREAMLKQRALRMLGVFYRDRNRTGEAAEHFALAVDAVRALPPPETAEHRLAMRADLYDLGVALAQLGYRGTARRALGEAREAYLKTEPEHPTLRAIDAQLKRLDEQN